MNITAIILAGGFGTRLRSLVSDLPKPMAPINGRPFLEYQLDYWIGQGVNDFILSVGYRHEDIISHFGDRYSTATLTYVIENAPLGTGGALLLACQKIKSDQPFLLLNGDTFFEVNLIDLLNFHKLKKSSWTFSLFRNEDLNRYMGVDILEDGSIKGMNSLVNSENGLVNGGVYLINPKILVQPTFILGNNYSLENDILPELFSLKQNIFGCEFSGFFIDIGIPIDYLRAAETLIK